MAYFLLLATTLFGCCYANSLLRAVWQAHSFSPALLLLSFQAVIEIGASFYAFAALYSAVSYLFIKESEGCNTQLSVAPSVGILYLCCNDLDRDALLSLAFLAYPGRVHVMIHDDSTDRTAQTSVNAAAEELRALTEFEVVVLRRPEKNGGKSGAVNYVLQETAHLYDYFLLCDNDSTIIDPLTIEKTLPYFEDNRLAIVQCRSVAIDSADYCSINRLLSRSIDAFHLFLATSSRFGWRLFIGHNAVIRTRAVIEAGGLTPDFFSDDLDLTIRLNLNGQLVRYAPEIKIGEKHPPTYDAFRRRTYKWSYGCMQMLKTHAVTVVTTRRLSFAEKLSFFYFTGFYVGQAVLLTYLVLSCLVTPFFLHAQSGHLAASLITGLVLVMLAYLPVCCFFLKEGTFLRSIGSIAMCGLVYGTTDFACVAGMWDCLRGKKRPWIPTNASGAQSKNAVLFWEFLFGSVLLLVPLLVFPVLLYLPSAYIFIGKFLFGPAVSVLYEDEVDAIAASECKEAAA